MYFLLEPCENPNLLKVIYFIKELLNLAFIVIPIVLIVMVAFDIFKAVTSNEDGMRKSTNIIIKRIIFAVVLFFVPLIVNLVTDTLKNVLESTDSKSYLTCWTNANKETIEEKEIKLEEEENRKEILQSEAYHQKLDAAMAKLQDTQIKYNVTNDKKEDDDKAETSNNNGTGTKADGGTIFVGDSRTNGLCNSVDLASNEECVYQDSSGYNWFNETAIDKVNAILKKNSSKTYNIVINLGVNDIGNASNYVARFNELKTGDWNKYNIIIVSVNPVYDAKTKFVDNYQIVNFNNNVSEGLDTSMYYCQTYDAVASSITVNDFDLEGLHYSGIIYNVIYTLMNTCIDNFTK